MIKAVCPVKRYVLPFPLYCFFFTKKVDLSRKNVDCAEKRWIEPSKNGLSRVKVD